MNADVVERVRALLPQRWTVVGTVGVAHLEVRVQDADSVSLASELAQAARHAQPTGRVVAFERVAPGAHAVAMAVDDGDGWSTVRMLLTGSASTAPSTGMVERVMGCGPTGVSVAVYGVDGTGKTTLARALPVLLNGCFSGTDYWHRFDLERPGDVVRPVTDPHGKAPRSLSAAIAKVGWYTLQAWVVREPRVRSARRRRRLIVLDRDLPDAWADPRRYRLRGPEPLLRVFDRAAPRPDLAFVLDADVETVMARSVEVPRESVAALLQRYRSLAEGRSWVTVLDASRQARDVAREAALRVVTYLERTALTRIGVP